ncbi:MAG: SDR family NAD(P)-dependent oxidoreductase [Pirellulaceae bacterium]|nr:beta-ketoacyl-ACP reductase [Planctomycetaceae bacterium]MDP6467589.1 SDR family NAD(P)-dependent oxidoreductase [Pirellulaceae bacterium]MDP6554715.1 SDR family NAD(P)-dependent oxidoreductase [Pirellulaceae bacterium]
MPESTRDLEGRTALVTGGAKGIGAACCLLLAKAGARVAVNYRSSSSAAKQLVARIESDDGTAFACQADVTSDEAVSSMVTNVEAALGPIDLLVNNAGIFDFISHEETTPEQWQRTLDINLTGCYRVTWAVKAGMIQRQFGRIVNMSSISALQARPMSIAYSVSKAGMTALTKSLAAAVAEYNIRVNAVAPGLIDTEIIKDVDPRVRESLVANTPLGRLGQPDDIAEMVLFLLSERSRYMTGQTIVASGGRVMLP